MRSRARRRCTRSAISSGVMPTTVRDRSPRRSRTWVKAAPPPAAWGDNGDGRTGGEPSGGLWRHLVVADDVAADLARLAAGQARRGVAAAVGQQVHRGVLEHA